MIECREPVFLSRSSLADSAAFNCAAIQGFGFKIAVVGTGLELAGVSSPVSKSTKPTVHFRIWASFCSAQSP